MLFVIGWLLLGGYLLNEGNEFWGNVVLWGGLVLIILAAVSGSHGQGKARADRQRHRDEEEDEILFLSLFDDD